MSWPRLFARICANTGWTWDYVRSNVDLPMLDALEQQWLDQPPVHRLVAAYLEYKPPAHTEPANDASLHELMSAMPVNPNAPALDNSAWEAFIAAKESPHGWQ